MENKTSHYYLKRGTVDVKGLVNKDVRIYIRSDNGLSNVFVLTEITVPYLLTMFSMQCTTFSFVSRKVHHWSIN